MTSTPVFELDRDTVRSSSAVITFKKISNNIATITTSLAHKFEIGWQVEIRGVDDTFNGTYVIESLPSTTQFTYAIVNEDIPLAGVVPNGLALVPSPAYVRYPVGDVLLDAFSSKTSFYSEPWDYNTVRILWSLEDAYQAKVDKDIEYELTPLVAITRSAFGYPITPLDGETIFTRNYMHVFASPTNTPVATHFESQKESPDNQFSRPIIEEQSFYDRNLVPGKWYYYSLFFYLKGDYASQRWVAAGQTSSLLPINYKHGEIFYDLVPPYYKIKDQEFTAGTGRSGTLERLLKIVGFEADYTRTLAEGIENSYNIDYVNSVLMHLVGETNLGVEKEAVLGDIRYRSLLAAINGLYEERGSVRGLRNLTFASTKYNSKTIEGINMLSLTDDAEFAFNTGSWGEVANAYSSNIGVVHAGTYNPVTLSSVDEPTSLSTRKKAMSVVKSGSGNSTNGIFIACGLGTGSIINRVHTQENTSFFPHLHGIRCDSSKLYKFSFYSKRIDLTASSIYAGIMWFNPPVDNTFNWTTDYIDKDEVLYPAGTGVDGTTFTVYSCQGYAPYPAKYAGTGHVYAVPYIVFGNSAQRYVSTCMFSPELNSANTFPLVQTDITLTLGTAETIGSQYLLGDQ
jgi:hypothetical protein